jgi:hypothetical protein
VGTKTMTIYVSDLDQSEIPAGQAYQLSIRHPDGSTQQLDISEKNYRDLKLAGMGKTLKKRGRKPGSTTAADGAPHKRRPRQNSKPPVTARPRSAGAITHSFDSRPSRQRRDLHPRGTSASASTFTSRALRVSNQRTRPCAYAMA